MDAAVAIEDVGCLLCPRTSVGHEGGLGPSLPTSRQTALGEDEPFRRGVSERRPTIVSSHSLPTQIISRHYIGQLSLVTLARFAQHCSTLPAAPALGRWV